MELWMRQIDLMAGSKSFTSEDGFEIHFDVPFSTSEDPDISEIKIYNLSNSSVAAISAKNEAVLNVGYRNDVGSILNGKVEEVSSEWSGVDKITKLTVSDGGFEWRNSRIQKTYQAESTAQYIMQDLAGVLGIEVAEIEPKEDITYKLGKTISGNVEKALKQLAKDTDSKMYINDNKLYIRDKDKGTSTGFFLNSDHGLIGSPEKIEEENEKGDMEIKYKIKCLLNHKIITDGLIQVESRTANGNFRVESGRHTCNGTEFITEMTVVPV